MAPKPFLPISKESLSKYCGVKPTDIDTGRAQDPSMWAVNEDGDFNIYNIVEYFRIRSKQVNANKARTDALEHRNVDVANELDKEKVLQLRIRNQVMLKDLVRKVDAEDRMVKLLSVIKEKIQFFVKISGTNLLGMTNPKMIELSMQKDYKKYVSDWIEQNADMIEWKDEGSSELLRTRIMERETDESERSQISSVSEGAEGFEDCGAETDFSGIGEYQPSNEE